MNSVFLNPLDAARQYLARGWRSVPVPYRRKGPVLDEWPLLRLEEADLPKHFLGRTNIGVLTGEPSGDLVDIDLDHPLAVELAPQFMPATSCVFGRASKLRSHWLYYSSGAVYQKQTIIGETIAELRTTGTQTVFPGSTHEEGELIEWAEFGEPAVIEYSQLLASYEALCMEVKRQVNERLDNLADDAELPDTSECIVAPDSQASGLKPGSDFSSRGDVREVLLRNGWTLVKVNGDVERWCRPGKEKAVSASLKDGKAFYCFTSSTAIPCSVETKRGYSPFAVLAYLEHGGDFSAAAKALAQQGYGQKSKSPVQDVDRLRKLAMLEPFRPFPTNVLPAVCADFVRQSSASIDCDESMVALPLLSSMAAAIGNSCRIQLKRDYGEPCVLWAAVACESGARKSPAVDAPLATIRKREMEEVKKHGLLLADHKIDVQHYKAALAEWQKKGRKAGEPQPKEPQPPACRRFTVSDVTTEALAVRLEQNPRGLLLVRDELSGFFGGLNQYKSSGKGADEAAFLAMHGARQLVVDRKNPEKPSIYVPRASLSIVGGIQPGILKRVLNRDRMESGMAARFLLAYPPPRAVKWRDKAVDQATEDRLASMFDWLLGVPLVLDAATNEAEPNQLWLTPKAKELWIAFHDEHSAEQAELHGDLSAAWAKLTGYAARLSLVCQLATWATGDNSFELPQEVDVEAIEAGITLANWFSNETKRIYAVLEETDEEREIRKLVEYIQRRGGAITERDLSRGPRRYKTIPSQAEHDLQYLVSCGAGEWQSKPASDCGGRPTRLFRLYPELMGDETPSILEENRGSGTVATEHDEGNGEGEWEG